MHNSVFTRQREQQQEVQQEIPCKGSHKWNGFLPTIADVHLLNSACDCGKFFFNFKGCSCDNSKKIVLKENPSYAG